MRKCSLHQGHRVAAAAVLAIPSMLVEEDEMDRSCAVDLLAQPEEVLHAGVRTTGDEWIERLDLHDAGGIAGMNAGRSVRSVTDQG